MLKQIILIGAISCLAILTAAAWFVLRHFPRKHTNVTRPELVSFFRRILDGGKGSSVFFIVKDERSLQFETYVENGEKALVLLFPHAAWSERYVAGIMTLVNVRKLRMWRSLAGTSRTADVIWVSFGQDAVAAADFAIDVVTNVYGVELARDCAVYVARLINPPA